MKCKIAVLDDYNVSFVRNKGKYGSNKNYEMMRKFKEWIYANDYWIYVKAMEY